MSRYGEGTCPDCHQEVPLRADLKLRKHRRWHAGTYSPSKWEPCRGSYAKPLGLVKPHGWSGATEPEERICGNCPDDAVHSYDEHTYVRGQLRCDVRSKPLGRFRICPCRDFVCAEHRDEDCYDDQPVESAVDAGSNPAR